ncbi:MAG: hypothetical protein HY896_06105 [Deltaproteobacteria bacterium]|nr:hypothetical protein [Deltaproteobacteria bacterium]
MRTWQDLLRAGAGLLALFVISGFFLGYFFDRMATGAANKWLDSAFHAPASAQQVKLRLLSGDVEVAGLRIGNPSGFVHKEFMTLRKAEMDVRLLSLLSDEIVADCVRTEGLIVRLERIEGRQNAREIFRPSVGKDGKEVKEGNKKEGKRFRIRRLVLRNTLLTYPVPGGEQVATVESMEIDEPLGREKSAGLGDAIAQLAVRSLRAGAGQAAERGLAGFLPAERDGAGSPGRARKTGSRSR